MESKKQTAVECLIEQFYNNEGMITTKQLEKALAMEKQYIMDAVNYGCSDFGSVKNAEQYYNETYNNTQS
jgi:hypothetical protein